MDIPGKLREDLKRIYGANDPMNYIEDMRAETNPDTQQEEIVVRLRVPRSCERYMCGLFVKPIFPASAIPTLSASELEYIRNLVENESHPPKFMQSVPVYASRPKKVFFNGNHTTLVWHDGSKTTVGVAPDEEFDEYTGFCTAIVKKLFGSSREAKKYMDKVKLVQKPKVKKKPDMIPMPGTTAPDWGEKHWGETEAL